MSELKRITFEQIINGEVNITSIINEVDFEVKGETAREIAKRRWFERKDHERE